MILNFSLTIACFAHVGNILYAFLNPENPTVKQYEKRLDEIEFPLTFKYCLTLANESQIIRNLGYKLIWEYYYGQSFYNRNLYGWTGHTPDNDSGTIFQTPEGMNCPSEIHDCLSLNFVRNFTIYNQTTAVYS